MRSCIAFALLCCVAAHARAENPIIRDKFTADPAALVHDGRVYLYTGHDEATPRDRHFVMRDWWCYSSDDMKDWKDEGSPLSVKQFDWARGDAWASQVIERDGKFYWYATARHRTIDGFSIGVAVADKPTGPFMDARGSALVTNDMTRGPIKNGREMDWDDLDPTVIIDDDGQAYLFWGNTQCYYAKLKANMIELDGPIEKIDLPKFTEAPWIHKRDGTYYLSFAHDFPEKIAYATAPKITGPWTFRGVINERVPNSPTNHQSIIEFKGKWYFFYHNAALPGGGEHRRSVCVEELFYEPDGSIRPITQELRGVNASANLAIVAKTSTSFVSGHETLAALNDGATPKRSDDTSHGAYGNWPRRGKQWVEYEWPRAVAVNATAVYWHDDARGVRVPESCRLQYWDGSAWTDVNGAAIGLTPNTFNAATFDEVKTTRLRLEMVGRGEFSTGVLEWRLFDAGGSPEFPPVLEAGVDRVVVEGGKTYLAGSMRSTGKPGQRANLTWSKSSGPGDVTFADAKALDTTATFSAPGMYELKLEARAGDRTTADTLRVGVEPKTPVADVSPVTTTRYRVTSPFWRPRLKALVVNWIPHCIAQNDKPDLKEGGINNIVEAGKKLAGKESKPHIGYPFSNAWVLNTVEAMCVAQMLDADGDAEIEQAQVALRAKLEEWIPLLLAAQEPDGYFQTRYTLGTARERERGRTTPQRWDERLRGEHVGYVAGYFIEAGIAHHVATNGKDRRLYDAAKKLADCWYDNIGPSPKKAWYDGHQAMEMALFRLARYVDEVEGDDKGRKYAELAKFLLDCRGTPARGREGEYDQSHVPVTQQYAAVGHAVRAVYSYAAMADAAKASGDVDYQSAVHSLSDNLVNRKYYITGGVGSGETSEGFGGDYSLPVNAYCESCSGAGMLFFQHKMHALTGHARHADLYEETLYNAILSDIDLAGENFTYTNALDSDEPRYKWHVCPCCVGNIPRTLLMLPTWTYAMRGDGIDVNLFVGGDVNVGDVAGTKVSITQTTNYPWDGKVAIVVNPEQQRAFKVRFRVPSRSVSEIYTSTPEADGLISIALNGQAITPAITDGYAVIDRTWKAGDQIDLELPLKVQRVRAVEQVAATRGRVALRYGPLVYNFEAVDQNLDGVLPPSAPLEAVWMPQLLGGVVAIKGQFADGSPLLAIPNYARNNRGGRSIVWIREPQQ